MQVQVLLSALGSKKKGAAYDMNNNIDSSKKIDMDDLGMVTGGVQIRLHSGEADNAPLFDKNNGAPITKEGKVQKPSRPVIMKA